MMAEVKPRPDTDTKLFYKEEIIMCVASRQTIIEMDHGIFS